MLQCGAVCGIAVCKRFDTVISYLRVRVWSFQAKMLNENNCEADDFL